MSAKVTKVRLYAQSIGLTQAFEFEHAERILRLVNSKWRIADGEKFEWVNDAIRPVKNRRGDKVTKQGE